MPIQAVLFHRDIWTKRHASEWLRNHGYEPLKAAHVTKNYLRYRIFNPLPGDVYRMLDFGNGVKAVNLVA